VRDDKNVLASRNAGENMIAKEGEGAGIRVGKAFAARRPNVPRAAPRMYLRRAESGRRLVLVHSRQVAVIAFIEGGILRDRDVLAVHHAEDNRKCLLRPLERRSESGIHRNIMQEMPRAFGLPPPGLGQRHIRPACEAIFEIPLRLPMANEREIGHWTSSNE